MDVCTPISSNLQLWASQADTLCRASQFLLSCPPSWATRPSCEGGNVTASGAPGGSVTLHTVAFLLPGGHHREAETPACSFPWGHAAVVLSSEFSHDPCAHKEPAFQLHVILSHMQREKGRQVLCEGCRCPAWIERTEKPADVNVS